MCFLTHSPSLHRTNTFSAIKWSSTFSDVFKQRRTSQDSTDHISASFRGRVTVSQEQNKNAELTQADVAKLHFMFLKCLKIFSSFRVNPLKKSIFLCLLFEFSLFGCYFLSMHLWELLIVLPIVTYKRTLVFFFLQILGYSKIIIKVISYFMWNKIVLVYFESFYDAGTCLDRILCQYLLCIAIKQ